MADGVAITAGSGTTILTDDTGAGGHAQVVKLAISTDGSGTLIPAEATNGLDVDVTRVIPGTTATALGKAEDDAHSSGDVGVMALGVRKDTPAAFGADGDYTPLMVNQYGQQEVVVTKGQFRISVASGGLTTSVTAYTAGDQCGTQFTLANAARVSGGTGRITHVLLVDANDIIGAVDVVFTRASVTLASDNAAYAISDSDALNVVSVVQLAGAFDIGNNRIAQAQNLNIPYDCSGGTSLYAGLITRAAHTFFTAVTDLQLIVTVERD